MAITKLSITGNTTAVGISTTPVEIMLVKTTATGVPVTPNDNITTTNVQAALEQLDDIKAQATNGTLTNPTISGSASFGDNDKAKFGASDDLQIYHTGSYSAIRDVGTGGLFIGGENYVDIGNAGASETYARFHKDAQVDLYHNNVKKLSTTATGINVTGTATMDGLVVDGGLDVNMGTGVADFSFNDGGYLKIHNASRTSDYRISTIGSNAEELRFRNGASQDLLRLNKNGDISFYEDTGTTPKFFWDASAERLGIGTTSPSELLHVTGASTAKVQISSTSTTGISGVHFGDPDDVNSGRVQYEHNTDHMGLYTNNTEKVRIDSSGNVGIGTSSPDSLLEVVGADPILTVRDTETGLASTNATLRLAESGGGDALNNYWDINYTANNALRVLSNTSERMRIDDTGNVGIGTTSPTAKLSIHEAVNTPAIEVVPTTDETNADSASIRLWGTRFGTANRYSEIRNVTDGSTANNELAFDTNGTERMRINSSGKVGIGTTNPQELLEVASNSSPTVRISNTRSDTSWDTDPVFGALEFYSFDGSGSGQSVRASVKAEATTQFGNSTELIFRNGDALGVQQENMRINYLGNVGIGTTSPAATLHVDASAPEFRLSQTGTAKVRFRTTGDNYINTGQNLGIGTTSPDRALHVSTSDNLPVFVESTDGLSLLGIGDSGGSVAVAANGSSFSVYTGGEVGGDTSFGAERMRIDSSGNVGIGTSSPSRSLDVQKSTVGDVASFRGSNAARELVITSSTTTSTGDTYTLNANSTNGVIAIATGSTERMRIDSSGNLLVGKTSASSATVGAEMRQDGFVAATRASAQPLILNRTTNDGIIADFRKDGTTVGSIGTNSGNIFLSDGARGIAVDSTVVYPTYSDGSAADNAQDLGGTGKRWKDIYATNGTIQTSDRNEKQDIAELSDAEQRVAVAAKGLLRKFRWRDAVEEKGDEARIHFGIIAQDLQDAFTAEGLDAGDYAMFINSTWTDEETGEERSRMGVRYSELLAFIISAI